MSGISNSFFMYILMNYQFFSLICLLRHLLVAKFILFAKQTSSVLILMGYWLWVILNNIFNLSNCFSTINSPLEKNKKLTDESKRIVLVFTSLYMEELNFAKERIKEKGKRNTGVKRYEASKIKWGCRVNIGRWMMGYNLPHFYR